MRIILALIPNKDKSSIQFVFSDFFTKEKQFVTAFDLEQSEMIGKDLIKIVNEIEKKKQKKLLKQKLN